jgi:hypothetical protein
MFLYKDVDFERAYYHKKSHTIPHTTVKEAGTPRFVQQALAWVDFQRIALEHQDDDRVPASLENLSETLGTNWESLIL